MIRLQTLTDIYNDQWICRECETEFWLDIREDFLKDVELCM